MAIINSVARIARAIWKTPGEAKLAVIFIIIIAVIAAMSKPCDQQCRWKRFAEQADTVARTADLMSILAHRMADAP